MSDNKKPHICEVLGVEVNTRFRITGYDHAFYIDDEGNFRKEDGDFVGYALFTAINHPERIIRKPHWTAEDIEDAKAIKRLFPGVETIHRGGANCTGLYIHDTCHYRLNDELFPTLKAGESVALDKILEAEHE